MQEWGSSCRCGLQSPWQS